MKNEQLLAKYKEHNIDEKTFSYPTASENGKVSFMINPQVVETEGHFPIASKFLTEDILKKYEEVLIKALDSIGISDSESDHKLEKRLYPYQPELSVRRAAIKAQFSVEDYDKFVENWDKVKQFIINDGTIIKAYDDIWNKNIAENGIKAITNHLNIFYSCFNMYDVRFLNDPEYVENQYGDYHIETFRISPGIYNELIDKGVFKDKKYEEDINDFYKEKVSSYYDEDTGEYVSHTTETEIHEQILTIIEGNDGTQIVNNTGYFDDLEAGDYTGSIFKETVYDPEEAKEIINIMHELKENNIHLGMVSPTEEDKKAVRDFLDKTLDKETESDKEYI